MLLCMRAWQRTEDKAGMVVWILPLPARRLGGPPASSPLVCAPQGLGGRASISNGVSACLHLRCAGLPSDRRVWWKDDSMFYKGRVTSYKTGCDGWLAAPCMLALQAAALLACVAPNIHVPVCLPYAHLPAKHRPQHVLA